jgi:two-component sensor histidine kinase
MRAPSTIRGRLIGLLLLATAPVLGLAAIGVDAFWRAALREAEAQVMLERDHAVALNRAAIASTDALLDALILALPADPARCEALLGPSREAGLQAVVADAEGRVTCGTALAGLAGSLARPVLRQSGPAAVLLAHPRPGGQGLVAAELTLRSPHPDIVLRLGAEPARFAAAALPDGAARRVAATDGTAWIAATGALAPGLHLVVARPEAPLRAAARATALRHLTEIVAILALGSVAVFLGAGHAVTRPLARLRAAVARWRGGAPLEIEDGPDLPEELRDLAEAFRDGAAALSARDDALSAAIARAELLAEEVHHRVKNNLQIVSSLLALQAGRVSDPAARAEFEATRDRVASLATLHRHMYMHHDPEAIDLGAFLEELGAQLFAAVGERPGRRIALEISAPPLRIASDQAVPLALLITEAVSGALKAGFPGARRGRIAIRMEANEQRARLVVEDDGEWPRAEDRLRAGLMRGFARQLGGELRAEAGRLELDLPLRPPLPRERVAARGEAPPG